MNPIEFIEKYPNFTKLIFLPLLFIALLKTFIFLKKIFLRRSRIQYILCQCTKGTLAGENFYQEISSNGELIANRDLEGRMIIEAEEIIEAHVVSDRCDRPSWGKKIDWSDLFFGKKDSGSWKR